MGSIKSLTFSRGPKGCHVCMYIYGTCTYVYSWVSQDIIHIYNHIYIYADYHLICTWDWYCPQLFSDRIFLGGGK